MRKFPYISVVVLLLAATLTSCGSAPLAKCSKKGNKVDCSYLNLENADIEDEYLPEANFEMANLNGAKIKYSDLRKASFHQANLEGAYLEGEPHTRYLDGTDFSQANLSKAELWLWDTHTINFSQADLRGATPCGRFINSFFEYATFYGGETKGPCSLRFDSSYLTSADFGKFQF